MKSASPAVKAFAEPLLKETYAGMPGVLKDPYTGAVMNRGAQTERSRIGAIVQQMPGGEQFVRMIPKTTLASFISGRDAEMYHCSGEFTPNQNAAGTWALGHLGMGGLSDTKEPAGSGCLHQQLAQPPAWKITSQNRISKKCAPTA